MTNATSAGVPGGGLDLRPVRRAQAVWAVQSVGDRLGVLRRIRHEIAAQGEALAAASASGRGRPVGEALTAEVIPLAAAVRFLERSAARLLAPRRVGGWGRPLWLAGVTSEVRREPWGVVLVIGPANYPLFLPGVQTFQALAAGNAVVLKPGEGGEAPAHALARLACEAGLDPELLTVLPVAPQAARAAIAAGVDKVVLTGSAGTGAAVLGELAPRLVPATMELSGCDAVFIRSDADLGLAVRALVFGQRLNGAATCIAPRRVFVPRPHAIELEGRLSAAFACERPVALSERLAGRLRPLVGEALAGGARVLVGSVPTGGTMCGPLVLAGVPPRMALLREDVFAPVLSLVTVEDDGEALALDGGCPYALGAAIFSRDLGAARVLAGRVRAGVVVINDLIVPTADPRLPFGGRGRSGFGVTRGVEGLLELTVPKTIAVNRSRWRLHYDPVGPGQAGLFTAYLTLAHGHGLGRRGRALGQLLRAMIRGRDRTNP